MKGSITLRAAAGTAAGVVASLALALGAHAQTADATAPVVGAVSPTTVTTNVATTFTASFYDAMGVTACDLYIDGSLQGSMSLTGSVSGAATRSYTTAANGSHTSQVRCRDAAGNTGIGTLTTFNASASSSGDVTPPVVGNVSPLSATTGASTAYTVSFTDNTGVTSCDLYVDGVNQGAMSLTGSATGTATRSVSIGASGQHNVVAHCRDAAGNLGVGTSATVNVSATVDTTAPSAPSNVHVSASGSTTATIVWNASSDDTGVSHYQVSVDGGTYASVGNTLSTQLNLTTGAHTAAVRAVDASGNVSGSSSISFTLSGVTVPPAPPVGPPFLLTQMEADANLVVRIDRDAMLVQVGACEFTDATASARVSAALGAIADANVRQMIVNFTGCGTATVKHLGAGERLGIVNSYRAAFGRLPSTSAHWYDVIKIGNGRFPGETSASAEASAKARFRVIYLREPNMSAAFDANAVVVMAYGLRPLPRNLSAEVVAQAHFRGIFGRTATSATDWDAVRAIAYSGATR